MLLALTIQCLVHLRNIYYCMGWSVWYMVRYCTSGLLYFTSQRRVKYSPQVQCLTIILLHSTPCNDKFIIIILTPKEMATTVATWAGAAMVELHDHY